MTPETESLIARVEVIKWEMLALPAGIGVVREDTVRRLVEMRRVRREVRIVSEFNAAILDHLKASL